MDDEDNRDNRRRVRDEQEIAEQLVQKAKTSMKGSWTWQMMTNLMGLMAVMFILHSLWRMESMHEKVSLGACYLFAIVTTFNLSKTVRDKEVMSTLGLDKKLRDAQKDGQLAVSMRHLVSVARGSPMWETWCWGSFVGCIAVTEGIIWTSVLCSWEAKYLQTVLHVFVICASTVIAKTTRDAAEAHHLVSEKDE
jgi:hypothetical protein